MSDTLSFTALFLDLKNCRSTDVSPGLCQQTTALIATRCLGLRKWEGLSEWSDNAFSSSFSLSFHVRTKEMGRNVAQWSSNCFKSLRHATAYKIDFNGRWWAEEQLCWKPKRRMHVIDNTVIIKWNTIHNTNNTSGYKFTSTRNYGWFWERKWHLAHRQFSYLCSEFKT